MKFNEQGRSMIEMLGVLAIVGVLSVGGIAGYSKAMAKFNTNKAIDQVNMMATNIRTMYASQANYDGLNKAVALRAGLIPNELFAKGTLDSTTVLNNPFGGVYDVTAAVATEGAVADTSVFYISSTKIPENACIALLTTEWGADSGGGLVAINVTPAADDFAIAAFDEDAGAGADEDEGEGELADATDAAVGGTFTAQGGLPVNLTKAVNACQGGNTDFVWKYL